MEDAKSNALPPSNVFELLAQAVPDYAIYLLDPAGTISTWNSGAELLLGYKASEIVGKHCSVLYPPEETAAGLPENELKAAVQLPRQELEGWRVRKDGSRFKAFVVRTATFDSHGRHTGYAQVVRDQTNLQQSQALLRSVLDHALDGIISIDDKGLIESFNRHAEKLFGYAESEVLGKNVSMLMPEPYHSKHDQYVRNYLETEQAKIIGIGREVVGLRKDGSTFPMDLAVSKFWLNGKRHFTGIVRELTEQKFLEEQLRQSQKMDAIGRLAGGIAHDFNNILTVILGYGEVLSEALKADAKLQPIIRQVTQAGTRAADLTRQLLAFSRQAVVEPRIIDLNTSIRELQAMLTRIIGEDVELTTVLAPNLPRVKIDPSQLGQVLMNLAVNSRDAMPQGGKLTIETSAVELDEHYTRMHREARPGRHVMLAVADTGMGMPPEVKARVFEPFFTTKEVGQGTGLGLSVVHGIVKQHEGSIEVYSEPGLGTVFKIYLPATEEKAAAVAGPEAANGNLGQETILLVEDDEVVRSFIELALSQRGYQMMAAARGDEALELAAQQKRIDLLVTDVVMPNMSGRILAEKMVEMHPKIKVLFVSGYTDDAIVRHGILHAEVAFLQKPFTSSALAAKVREVLHHE